MTENPDIPRRLHEHYPRVKNDEVVKLIFNTGKNKEGKGMKIQDWMVIEEIKYTAHYQMYATVFRELDQLLEGNENVDTDEFVDEILYSKEDPSTKIKPMSDKESPEVRKSVDVLIIHEEEEEEESVGDALIRRKGKGI
nr:hypothetical protein [Tanacetum cinerariifolium]